MRLTEKYSYDEANKQKAQAFDQMQAEAGQRNLVKQAYDKGKQDVVTTIDQDLARVYGQGGLAGMARDEQIQVMNQQKNDVAQAILMGSPEEAMAATKWAMDNKILTEPELQGVTQARGMREEQLNPRVQEMTPQEMAMLDMQAETGQSNFQEQGPTPEQLGLAGALK
jgi:hypothetical protein